MPIPVGMAVLFRRMILSYSRFSLALGRAVFFLLALLLVSVPGRAASAPTPSPQASINLSELMASYPFLHGYQFSAVPLAASLAGQPNRVRQDKGVAPAWKERWDEARRLALAGNLASAVAPYQAMLGAKDVAEARWELVTILAALGRDREAMENLDALIDTAGDRPEYQQCLAVVSLRLGRFREAARAFARLQGRQPDNDDVLAGEVLGLLAADDKQAALPRLEALWRRNPANLPLRTGLATLAYEMQAYDMAWPHLVVLAEGSKPAPALLLMAARASALLRQRPEQGLRFWQRYVEARPDDLEGLLHLATFFEKSGQVQQALPYLLAIHRLRPDDLSILRRLGLGYALAHDYGRAIATLEEYAALRPKDKEIAVMLVKCQEALGHKAETLRALSRYLALEPQPAAADLKRAARLYEESGAESEALAVYRRLVAMHPDAPGELRELARLALAAGQEEEALAVYQRLARLFPDEQGPYRGMAEILARLGRQPELYETLAILHRLEPADHGLSLKLVEHYCAEGNTRQAAGVLDDMAREQRGEPLPAPYHYWRGALSMQRQDSLAALTDLDIFLRHEPGHEAARRQALIAAGRIGDIQRVRAHARVLMGEALEQPVLAGEIPTPAEAEAMSPELQFMVAQAYAGCRAEAEARRLFLQIINGAAAATPPVEILSQAFQGLAQTYSRENRPYEAEEALRLGLVTTKNRQFFLPQLFALGLAQGQVGEAGAWLAALRPLMAAGSRRLALMEAQLLTAQGEARQARRLLRTLDLALDEQDKSGAGTVLSELLVDRLAVAAQWLKNDRRGQAAKQCAKVLACDDANLEAKVLLALSQAPLAQGAGRLNLAELRADQLFELIGLYQRYGLTAGQGETARQAMTLVPQSLSAGLCLIDSIEAQGDFAAAQAQLARLAAETPNEFSLTVRQVTLQSRQGDLLAVERALASPMAQSWPELILLRARLLWRQNRFAEALSVYRDYLTPKVAVVLGRLGGELRVALPEAMVERTVWEVLTKDPGPDPDSVFCAKVMAPAAVMSSLDLGDDRFALAAARLFATYRWQSQVAMELAARQSVVRREYTIAQKQYETLLARYPQERLLLYDLAGMSSRLGDLGHEAAAYDQLSAAGIDFPELAAARRRNLLKQQPRMAVTYGYQSDAGRQGYLDMTQDRQGLLFWDSLYTQHEAEMRVERVHYRAGNWGDVVRANRAVASYSAGLLSGLTVRGGGGIETQTSGGDGQAFLLNAALIGKIGDGLMGNITFDRDAVRDTTASLKRHLFRQDLLGGVTLTPLPRLSMGGNYLFRDYSDNNWTTGYDVWSSYLILAEPTFLQLKYSYDFKESRQGAIGTGGPWQDGFAVDDHPYWAPKHYWLNQVGVFFKHSLSEELLERGTPQYYTLEYALGHDVDGYAVQTVKVGLYAELHPHFLVEAASELANSQAFRRQDYRLSFSYRW